MTDHAYLFAGHACGHYVQVAQSDHDMIFTARTRVCPACATVPAPPPSWAPPPTPAPTPTCSGCVYPGLKVFHGQPWCGNTGCALRIQKGIVLTDRPEPC